MTPREYLLDLVDVLIVAFLFYRLLLVFRQTRALRVLFGLGVLGLAYVAADFFRLEALLGLVDAVRGSRLEIGVVLLAVIFADEIKNAFAGMFWNFSRTRPRGTDEEVVEQVSRACIRMADNRCGAILAIAQSNPLDRWEIADSVRLDAAVSAPLLETIFSPKTALHDGAVLIRSGRVVAAKCQFPPSSNPAVTALSVGMRHRAAFGLSEMSDAVVVVVSEERGDISVAHRGRLHSPVPGSELRGLLQEILGIGTHRPSWISPRRWAADGALKGLALALALALWANQEATFRLKGPVRVVESADGAARRFPLVPGKRVVAQPEGELVDAGREAETTLYEQRLPSIRYELVGRNLDRAVLLPRLIPYWLAGRDNPPADLLGTAAIVMPAEAVGTEPAAGAAISCPLIFLGEAFTPRAQSINVQVDRLVALAPHAIRVAFTGRPAAGYTVLSESPIPVALPGGRNLVVPALEREAVEAALNPCPTSPPIAIESLTEFNQEVDLRVPPALRRWNPEPTFRTRVVLEILSEKIRLEAQERQLPEGRRRELETQRAEADRRAHEARDRWLEMERKMRDGTWEVGYRLEQYETLVQRSLPDLEKRLEKAELELAAVTNTIERLRADTPATRTEQELVRARLTICLKEQEWRREIVEASRDLRDLLRREAQAVGERIRPALDAVDKAVRLRDESGKGEAPLPPVDSEKDLQGLVEHTGPAGAAVTEGGRAISAAASARSALNFFARAITGFERWQDAVRESQGLAREVAEISKQLAAPPAPGSSTIRLELSLREKEMLLEARRRVAARQVTLWKELRPRLQQSEETFAAETALLERIVRSWTAAAATELAVAPFLELHREVEVEAPTTRAAVRFLGDPQAGAGDEELSRAAREALEIGERQRRSLRARMSVLAQVLQRATAGTGDAAPAFDFSSREAELSALREDRLRTLRLLEEIRSDARIAALGDLDQMERSRADLQARIERRKAEISALEETLEAASAGLGPLDAGVDARPELRAAAANLCVQRTIRHYLEEGLTLMEAQDEALRALEETLRAELGPLWTTLRTRLAEVETQGNSPQPERDAAIAYLESRALEHVLLQRIGQALDRAGTEGLPPEFGSWVLQAFTPLPKDDQGIEHMVAVQSRRDIVRGIVSGLENPGPEEAVAAGRSAAEVEMRRRIREAELAMRQRRLALLEETLDRLRAHLFGTQPIRLMARRLGDAMSPAIAAALPLDRMNAASRSLEEAILRRRTQQDEALAEARKRTVEAERNQFERRAEAIEARLLWLEGAAQELETLIRLTSGVRGSD